MPAESGALNLGGDVHAVPSESSRAAPADGWLVATCAFAAAAIMYIGWHWDISWHRSIGRDTALTLPHLAIYASLILSFVASAVLVLDYTFGRRRSSPAIRVLGFRAPSGAFLTLWGLALQGAAIVFDLWWHDAYGLDLGIFSPPHYAIMIGGTALIGGLFLLVLRQANALRDSGRDRVALRMGVGFAGLALVGQVIGFDPAYGPSASASLAMIVSASLAVPFLLSAIDAWSGNRWASVAASLVYAAFMIALMQIFQLFPATPKFGPVYVDPERLLPPAFPLPIVAPALAIALAFPIVERRLRGILRSLAHGVVFALALALAGRLQAAWLASPGGDNRFFAGRAPGSAFQADYLPTSVVAADGRTVTVLLVAALLAALSAWIGARAGKWLRAMVR